MPSFCSSWLALHPPQVTKLNAISILSGLAVVVVNWLVTVAVRQARLGHKAPGIARACRGQQAVTGPRDVQPVVPHDLWLRLL